MDQLKDSSLSVAPYTVAWRIEIVDDVRHRGFEYVRFCWGTTEWSWAVRGWSKDNGAKVITWTENNRDSVTLLMWKLIPVRVEPRSSNETEGQEFPPSYEGDTAGQSSTRTQRAESERDDFGTVVTEVTTVTTSTRRRYRVDD